MPNHFHLLIKQIEPNAMEGFMRSLATRYSTYFNKRYNRVGKLFQAAYKACIIENDNYLLYLSRYIHRNPGEYSNNLANAHSSYGVYLGLRTIPWVKPQFILSFFNQASSDFLKGYNTYKHFVEASDLDREAQFELTEKLILE